MINIDVGEEIVIKTKDDFKKDINVYITTYPFSELFTASNRKYYYHFTKNMSKLCGRKFKISKIKSSYNLSIGRNTSTSFLLEGCPHVFWEQWMIKSLTEAKIQSILNN